MADTDNNSPIIRYNLVLNRLEYFNGSDWYQAANSPGSSGQTGVTEVTSNVAISTPGVYWWSTDSVWKVTLPNTASVPNQVFYLNGIQAMAGGQTEYSIPTPSSVPNGICVGPDNNIWFTENGPGKIGVLNLTNFIFTEYALSNSNSQPVGICTGPDGNLWFTEYNAATIGKITPGGVITEYSAPGTSPAYIVTAPDGNLYFTDANSHIGKITTSGIVTLYSTPSNPSNPYDLCIGADGNVWFTEDVAASQIGTFNITTQIFTEYVVPTSNSSPSGICSGPDGNIWFVEYGGNNVAKCTLSGSMTEYPIPTGSALPTYICTGADGNLWFTEDNTNQIGKCTTSGVITEYPLTVSGSSPLDICLGPDNNLWITEQAGGYLIRYAPSSATFQSINNQTLDGVNITTSPYILGNTQVGIVSDGSNWYSL